MAKSISERYTNSISYERDIEIFFSRLRRNDGCIVYPNTTGEYVKCSRFVKWIHEYFAHRISWVIWNGPVPDGLKVLHHCDVRNCCNEEHLFLGTSKDNTRDMISKGRNSTILDGVQAYHQRWRDYKMKTYGRLEVANPWNKFKK